MKKYIAIFLVIGLIILLSGCNSGSQNEFIGVDLPIEQMNIDLTLDAPPELSEYEIGKYLVLVLKNNANTPITFPLDYGVYLYQSTSNEWKPIENIIDYGYGEKIIYPISEGPLILEVWPDIDINDKPVVVRVVVKGNYLLDNGDIGDEVGAYIDLNLQP